MSDCRENQPSGDEAQIAVQFVRARLEARSLAQFPGTVPTDLAAAYRCQELAIARWPEPVAGWKVAKPSLQQSARWGGVKRIIGPAFSSQILSAAPGQSIDCSFIPGGMNAFDGEIVIRVGRDAPPAKIEWTIDEAADMVGELCIGIEIVCSPLPTLKDYDVAAVVADFAACFGMVTGPVVADWRKLDRIRVTCSADGTVGRTGVTTLRDGPLDAYAFTLGECARRGRPLKAGALITTGAVTASRVVFGQSSSFMFEGLGEIRCRAVEAMPRV